MSFNTPDFLIFFAVIFTAWLYVRHRERALRNGFLLLASYFFYGYWSPPFVGLLLVSTLVDFYLGRAIAGTDDARRRKQLLSLSVIVNLGILGFFKYFNFFIDTAVMALPEGSFAAPALEVILPVGISFYTFQSMSYSIDVYRGNTKPADSLIDFALYVAFFPQLVAGPIERAGNMLPQFLRGAQINLARSLDGLDLCVRGYFKKVVIADNIAPLVNFVYGDVDSASSLGLWVATYAFAIQIYCDFSAYTDIARGTAKLLGFELMENFRSPYRSVNVAEMWRRWHISLSTWFRDYLFLPLGGLRADRLLQLRALFLVMALAGLWHGAAWNFVVWGLFHGVLLVVYSLASPYLRALTAKFNRPGRWAFTLASWFLTFHLLIISFVMFRAQSFSDIGTALQKMLLTPVSEVFSAGWSYLPNAGRGEELFYLMLIAGTLLMQFTNFDARYKWLRQPLLLGARAAVALALIFFLYPTVQEQFIYFQF